MAKQEVAVNLQPIAVEHISITIEGIAPLIQHRWSEKAKEMMRQKHAGKKTKNRDVRDPQAEAEEAAYRTEDGKHGIPVDALKAALITAAHKDLGIEKTLVKKALFIRCTDANRVLPLSNGSQPVTREDCVRVGMGSADLRYRPEFREWSVDLHVEFDSSLLRVEDIVNLFNRAGFGVGIGEWRPEKGGEFGRFKVA